MSHEHSRCVPASIAVVKVGGSLYDLPDVGLCLEQWLSALSTRNVLIVPGGGRTADVVRHIDQTQHLGQEASHWLALRALSLNAHILHCLLNASTIVTDVHQWRSAVETNRWPIVDMHAFAIDDERRPGRLPHVWDVTSDSLAVRLAQVVQADIVYLLKSVSAPENIDWHHAAAHGWVDRYLPTIVQALEQPIAVRVVNFRELKISDS